MSLVIIGIIGFFSGLIKGTSGFGSSLLAIPFLVFFYPIEEVVVMMITYNVILNTLLHFEDKGFRISHLKEVYVLTLFGVMATFIGIYFLGNLNETVIKRIAGLLIFFAVANKIFKFEYILKDNFINQAITGFFSGLGNGIASIDGPPVVFFLTGIKAEKKQFKNTLASYFLFLGIMSVAMLSLTGRYSVDILLNTAYVAIFASIGVIVGMVISKRLSENAFDMVIVVVLLVLGGSLMV